MVVKNRESRVALCHCEPRRGIGAKQSYFPPESEGIASSLTEFTLSEAEGLAARNDTEPLSTSNAFQFGV